MDFVNLKKEDKEIYDLMKKVFQKNEIAGALTILVINVLMFFKSLSVGY